jgi:hypothetical protein
MARTFLILGSAAFFAIAVATTGLADPAIDKNTSCSAVVGYLDRKDTPHAQEAYRVAKQLMADLDAASTGKGQTSLLAPLTPEHAEDVYILVLESCRDYPQQTLGKTAADTYDGLRDLRDHPASR